MTFILEYTPDKKRIIRDVKFILSPILGTKNSISLSDYFEIPKISELTLLENEKTIQEELLSFEQANFNKEQTQIIKTLLTDNFKKLIMGKLVEELLEYYEAFITENKTVETKKDEIEETFDIFNTTCSVFIILCGKTEFELKINEIFKDLISLNSEMEYFEIYPTIRLANSYQHLKTVLASKTGLNSIKDTEKLLEDILVYSAFKLLDNFQNPDLTSQKEMIIRKLKKWESKIH